MPNSSTAYDLYLTRDEILEMETVAFLEETSHHVKYMARLFNTRISDKGSKVAIFQSSAPMEGVLLKRNLVLLRVSSLKPGTIQFQCSRETSEKANASVLSTGLVEASFSTFHDVSWSFLGERVTGEKLACHFLTEFLQLSLHQ